MHNSESLFSWEYRLTRAILSTQVGFLVCFLVHILVPAEHQISLHWENNDWINAVWKEHLPMRKVLLDRHSITKRSTFYTFLQPFYPYCRPDTSWKQQRQMPPCPGHCPGASWNLPAEIKMSPQELYFKKCLMLTRESIRPDTVNIFCPTVITSVQFNDLFLLLKKRSNCCILFSQNSLVLFFR